MQHLQENYNEAVQLIKKAVLESQREAVKAVNSRMLSLYYGVGKFVSETSRKRSWGTKALEEISRQLKIELPGLKGFSVESIKKMRMFYEQWSDFIIRSPMATELESADNVSVIHSDALFDVIRSPMANELDWQDFFSISFSHHMEILHKTSTLEERAFYIHQTAVMHWDKISKLLRQFRCLRMST